MRCPMCGEPWDGKRCATCGWKEKPGTIARVAAVALIAALAIGCAAKKKPKPAPSPHAYNYEFRGVVDGQCTVASVGLDPATGKTILYCLEGAR